MSETTDNSKAGGRCAPALGSAIRPLNLTVEEINYLWHLADDHKMTTTGEEPDALVLCSLLHKIGALRETPWPNDQAERRREEPRT